MRSARTWVTKSRKARMLAGVRNRLAIRMPTVTSEASAMRRRADAPDGGAGGGHHDQLAVAVHAVERVERGHQHRVRRDQRHQARQAEHGHLQEQQNALAARGDEVEFLQRRGEPDDDRQRQQNDDERIRHLPKHVSAEERHGRCLDPPNGPLGVATLSYANPLVPKTIPISLRWRNFGVFGMACFPKRLDLPSAAAISRRCCRTAPVSPLGARVYRARPIICQSPRCAAGTHGANSVTDQTTLSFASGTAPADGVAVVFAEEGPRLTPAAKDLDKKSKGLLSQAIGITGFKGKKEQTVDLIAPPGTRNSRESWWRASASQRLRARGLGQSRRHGARHCSPARKRRPRISISRRTSGAVGADRCREFRARCAAARLQVQEIQEQGRQEERRCEGDDKTLKKIVIHCGDPKAAAKAFAAAAARSPTA